jgi:hypothetical protein
LQDPGPNCKNLSRWKDWHAKTKLPRVSLTKLSKPHRGSWIQRLPARACAVDRAVSSAHGSTVDRLHNLKGYAIATVHARSHGPGRLQATDGGEHAGVRRRAAEGSPVWPYLAAQDAKSCARGLYSKLGSTRASLGGHGGGAGIHGGRRRKGAGRPRRRGRGAAKACKEGKTGGGNFARHVKKRRVSSQEKGRRQ